MSSRSVPISMSRYRCGDLARQLSNRTIQNDLPVCDDHDVLTEVFDKVELVAGEHNRSAMVGSFDEDFDHGLDADRVEPGERFVEDQQLGIMYERGGELDSLLIAVRQFFESAVRSVARSSRSNQADGSASGGSFCHTVQSTEVGQLGGHPHSRIQAALFRHVAEAEHGLWFDCLSVPSHLAGVRRSAARTPIASWLSCRTRLGRGIQAAARVVPRTSSRRGRRRRRRSCAGS